MEGIKSKSIVNLTSDDAIDGGDVFYVNVPVSEIGCGDIIILKANSSPKQANLFYMVTFISEERNGEIIAERSVPLGIILPGTDNSTIIINYCLLPSLYTMNYNPVYSHTYKKDESVKIVIPQTSYRLGLNSQNRKNKELSKRVEELETKLEIMNKSIDDIAFMFTKFESTK
jgi:hypothetical protein